MRTQNLRSPVGFRKALCWVQSPLYNFTPLDCVIFGDDINLFCSGNILKELLDAVEEELQSLKKRFGINKLSLNVKKKKRKKVFKRTDNSEASLRIYLESV